MNIFSVRVEEMMDLEEGESEEQELVDGGSQWVGESTVRLKAMVEEPI